MPAGLDLRRTLRGHLDRHQEPPAGTQNTPCLD
jgi:hypothetical protein